MAKVNRPWRRQAKQNGKIWYGLHSQWLTNRLFVCFSHTFFCLSPAPYMHPLFSLRWARFISSPVDIKSLILVIRSENCRAMANSQHSSHSHELGWTLMYRLSTRAQDWFSPFYDSELDTLVITYQMKGEYIWKRKYSAKKPYN